MTHTNENQGATSGSESANGNKVRFIPDFPQYWRIWTEVSLKRGDKVAATARNLHTSN